MTSLYDPIQRARTATTRRRAAGPADPPAGGSPLDAQSAVDAIIAERAEDPRVAALMASIEAARDRGDAAGAAEMHVALEQRWDALLRADGRILAIRLD